MFTCFPCKFGVGETDRKIDRVGTEHTHILQITYHKVHIMTDFNLAESLAAMTDGGQDTNTLDMGVLNTNKVYGNAVNQFKFDTSILAGRNCLINQNDLHAYALVDVNYSIDGGVTKHLLKTQSLFSNDERTTNTFIQLLIALAFRKSDYDLQENSQSKISKIDDYIKAIRIKVDSGKIGKLGSAKLISNDQLALLSGYTPKAFQKTHNTLINDNSDSKAINDFQGDFNKTLYGFLNLSTVYDDVTNKFVNIPISFNEDKINSLTIVHQAIYIFAHKVYELGGDFEYFTSKFQLSLSNLRAIKGDTKPQVDINDF